MLQDIAILTGGEMFTEELGIKLENVFLMCYGINYQSFYQDPPVTAASR